MNKGLDHMSHITSKINLTTTSHDFVIYYVDCMVNWIQLQTLNFRGILSKYLPHYQRFPALILKNREISVITFLSRATSTIWSNFLFVISNIYRKLNNLWNLGVARLKDSILHGILLFLIFFLMRLHKVNRIYQV